MRNEVNRELSRGEIRYIVPGCPVDMDHPHNRQAIIRDRKNSIPPSVIRLIAIADS